MKRIPDDTWKSITDLIVNPIVQHEVSAYMGTDEDSKKQTNAFFGWGQSQQQQQQQMKGYTAFNSMVGNSNQSGWGSVSGFGQNARSSNTSPYIPTYNQTIIKPIPQVAPRCRGANHIPYHDSDMNNNINEALIILNNQILYVDPEDKRDGYLMYNIEPNSTESRLLNYHGRFPVPPKLANQVLYSSSTHPTSGDQKLLWSYKGHRKEVPFVGMSHENVDLMLNAFYEKCIPYVTLLHINAVRPEQGSLRGVWDSTTTPTTGTSSGPLDRKVPLSWYHRAALPYFGRSPIDRKKARASR